MSGSTALKPADGSPADASPVAGSRGSRFSLRNRSGSINSMSPTSTVDQEQLAHALDQIHTSASHPDFLTLFNDFAPPPERLPSFESRGSAGELAQHGLSGLYSRFREVVGGVSPTRATSAEVDISDDAVNGASKRTSVAEGHSSRPSISSSNRADSAATVTSLTSQPTARGDVSSPVLTPSVSDMSRSQMSQASKATSISLMSGQKLLHASGRQSLPTKATSAVVADPTIAPPLPVHRDASRSSVRTDDAGGLGLGRTDLHPRLLTAGSSSSATVYDAKDAGKLPTRCPRDDGSSVDGGDVDASVSPAKAPAPAPLKIGQRHHARSPSASSSLLSPDGERRRPAVIEKISRPKSPAHPGSRDSSHDRGPAVAALPIHAPAHSFIHHASFVPESHVTKLHHGRGRIPGTTAGQERASDQMNAQLDKMRRQVLSKEFWMKDDTVKECFLCQTPFTAFRRKHHCRTCGCIFDSKCTTVVSGEKFGVQGSLRVCKNCLEVISRRFDTSGSDDSADERSFLPRIFGPNHAKAATAPAQSSKIREHDPAPGSEGSEDSRPISTPMMAIPATRRVRESNRSSAILEIDAPQLSRPSSSRSLKSLNAARPQSSAGHKRHHSKHGFLGRFKPNPSTPPLPPAALPPADERAPFRKGINDDSVKKSKLPAFHDDNIIDPDLADYMSDDSSGDEQMNIFAAMGTSDLQSASFENEKSAFAPLFSAARKHRHRTGEKSASGLSYASRGAHDDANGPTSLVSHRRTTRRRNLSNVSGSIHHHGSLRPKSAIYKGPSASSEMLPFVDNPGQNGNQLTGHDFFRSRKQTSKEELNQSSLKHVDKLLHQLLTDAEIPSPAAWQKALVPILLQLTDDVTPDVAKGEDMDIRHYVKLKRVPGGKPSDITYVSGVVFTKNLALKSMARRITNPRIVLVTFPIEYQRHQQHFMSLQPVIEQEKEYLRVVVQRITNLRPNVVLAQKGVSGVALQYLSEASISVAYNVKDTVIEAVARCAEAEIVESLDMLALPVRVGKCSAFEVRTFVNNDYPGRKKSYIFLSGCRADLGCTIALRGANSRTLGQMKQIMEFMVYVVYNLKLETSLLRDECIEHPDGGDGSVSSSVLALNDSLRSLSFASAMNGPRSVGPTTTLNHPSSESEPPSQATANSYSCSLGGDGLEDAEGSSQATQSAIPPERRKLLSLHEHHSHASQDSQVPDDVPMPTFYSDMVAKYETKILSASPHVKFKQPYLLMKAREQERRLLYLRRLRDQDTVEEDSEKYGSQRFQLIKPEMVEKIGQKAPRQIMEILHAVHDAEYDKALFNYQTQTRQWETYIQGNLDLFDPYSHQNIVVLYSVICTETKIPCIEPSLVAINFYDEQHVDTGMDPDCTLGQYIEDLAYSKNDVCNSNGCEKRMAEHHRTYVHDQHRITVFVEYIANIGPRRPELGDGITMWTYCKLCKKDSEETAMSEATSKYSFGKYLELLYWGRGLRMKNVDECPHDHYPDHVRYFCLGDSRIRIHWDPIDLLEIVVPRARITWKVVNDLKLKNEIFTKMEERWSRFMASVRARLKSIRIDSVLPEKAVSCKAEVERLMKKAQEEQPGMVRQLQNIYVNSKYYEIVPFNSLVREMLEKAGEWDQAFAKLELDYLGDKDMRQLTIMQLKKMFTDNESKESLALTEGNGSTADSDDRPSQTFSEADDKNTQPTDYTVETASLPRMIDDKSTTEKNGKADGMAGTTNERVEPLDVASSPTGTKAPIISPTSRRTAPLSDVSIPHSPSAISTSPAAAFQQAIASACASPPPSPSDLCRSPPGPSPFGPSLSDNTVRTRRESVLSPGAPTGASRPTLPSGEAAEGATAQTDVSRPALPPRPAAKGARAPSEASSPGLPLGEAAEDAKSPPEASRPTLPSGPATEGERAPTDAANPSLPLFEGARSPPEMSRPNLQPGSASEVVRSPTEKTSRPAAERAGSARKSGPNLSSPMMRATSHPIRPFPRSHSTTSVKLPGIKDFKPTVGLSDAQSEQAPPPTPPQPQQQQQQQQPEVSVKNDKKLSDRLGLTALKHRSKGAASGIPRLVHKKRESKVSALARHFEQLSREFEKERMRDRKQRSYLLRQSRARLPRTSTKAIVQVYDDVNEAFEEPAMTTDAVAEAPVEQGQPSLMPSMGSELHKSEPSTEPPTPTAESGFKEECPKPLQSLPPLPTPPPPPKPSSTHDDNDDASNANTIQINSDDEGAGSDLDASVPDEFLPDIKEIAESLEPSTDIPLELPKHQKTSLMKYLTNFWAERSASGWPPLEYPVNSTDHIFVDSDIIVREDEPSSVIALALNSEDYKEKLANIRREAQEVAMQRDSEVTGDAGPGSLPTSESPDWTVDETEQEKSLLRSTGTHLKYQFKEGAAVMMCKIFYAEQFDALRRKCGIAERIVECLSRCLKWDSRGGKTKSVFLKTLDDRLVLKSLSPIETSTFLRFAPGYFSIMAEALFHDLPSVIAKMLGFFQVIIKNPTTGTDTKLDLLITENLFYDRSPSRIFDLKGSMRNRKIQSTGEQNEVLLDENMVEYIYESPLFAREHSKKLLRASVWNDTLFLARQNVMDYSLMIAVDEDRKELVVGIIDCIRTYTWDKKLESWIKDRGFGGGGRNRPTVTSPKEYKSRFREAMARYILQAPNCWHLFNNPQYPAYYGRARFEDPETQTQ